MSTPTMSPPSPVASPRRWRTHGTAIGLLALVVLVMVGDVLFDPRPMLLGEANLVNDMYKQFAYWRQFGFDELARGNLALWNPHIFCGCPFFGGMQSALLYPPNWLFMVLPLVTALNLSLALHLWLAGVFMYAWAFRRGLGRLASFVAGMVLMLSGAVFMQLMPGHLPHLCTLAWAPLVLLVIDALVDRPSLRWVLLGALAVAMQILAGHPQYFFYTAVTAGVYAVLNLIKARRRLVASGAIASMFVIAAALSAVQLLTTMSESAETLRSTGMELDKAAQYSFPPENFLCFLVPTFFGGAAGVGYWGRWFLWEVQPFIGITGLFLACYGALTATSEKRRFSVVMVILTLVLAVGAYIPFLFRLTHDYVPGFDRFRNSCRFLYPATLFLAMLAGLGLRNLLDQRRFLRGSAGLVLLVALVLAGAGMSLRIMMALSSAGGEGLGALTQGDTPGFGTFLSAGKQGLWADVLSAMRETGQSRVPSDFAESEFIQRTGHFAGQSLLIAAATAGALAVFLYATRRWPVVLYFVIPLVVVELVVFTRGTQRPTFEFHAGLPQAIWRYVTPQDDGSRTLNPFLPNLAMVTGGADLWGYDSFVLRRYMEFMVLTQGQSADQADYFQHLGVLRWHPLFAMLRCRLVLGVDEKSRSPMLVRGLPHMNRLHLLGHYQVRPNRQAVFQAMNQPDFDPWQTVMLEQEPTIRPVGVADAGWAKVVEESTDAVTIEAELTAPAILLMTDSYSSHWRARPLDDGSQREYTVMPANYCLRAVPLKAGRHRFRLEYDPVGYRIGRWISLAAVLAWVAAAVLCFRRRRKGQPTGGRKPADKSVQP